MALLADPSEKSKPIRQRIYSLMRHAPGKNGRLVDTLLPAPPQRPTSWKNAEFQRAEDDTKMPKLWGTAGKPLQNQQLGNKDRKSVEEGKGVTVGVELGGGRINKKKKK